MTRNAVDATAAAGTSGTAAQGSPAPAVRARDRILASARQLFRTQGINATGIDAIISRGEVARGSLYYNFSGKSAIVAAYLEEELVRWGEGVRAVDAPDASPATRLAAFFAALEASVSDGTFIGCPFTNAVVEQPTEAAVREIAQRYRAALHGHVAGLIARTPDDTTVARIVLLYEGAIAGVKVSGTAAPVHAARELALQLIGSSRAE